MNHIPLHAAQDITNITAILLLTLSLLRLRCILPSYSAKSDIADCTLCTVWLNLQDNQPDKRTPCPLLVYVLVERHEDLFRAHT